MEWVLTRVVHELWTRVDVLLQEIELRDRFWFFHQMIKDFGDALSMVSDF